MFMIRRMEQKDVAAVAGLERACFHIPWSETALNEYVGKPDALFCVCEYGEKIAGYGGMYYTAPEGNITNVAVLEQYRLRGIACSILEFMIREAQKEKIVDFTLEVRESNQPAIRLYEKFGFRVEGTRKNYYQNPTENALIMWKRRNYH